MELAVKTNGLLLLILLFSLTTLHAQVVRNDSRIWVGSGIMKSTDQSLNELPDHIERVTEANGLLLPINNFNRHLQFFAGYEEKIDRKYSYMINLEYNSERLSNSSVDNNNQIFQGVNYELQYYTVVLSVHRFFDAFPVELGYARLFTGVGLEYFYANAEMSYQFDQRPLQFQVINFTKFGSGYGGQIYGGLDVPFMPSFYIRLLAGYSLRNDAKLDGKIKASNETPIAPINFEGRNRYNFTGVWFRFSFGFEF